MYLVVVFDFLNQFLTGTGRLVRSTTDESAEAGTSIGSSSLSQLFIELLFSA